MEINIIRSASPTTELGSIRNIQMKFLWSLKDLTVIMNMKERALAFPFAKRSLKSTMDLLLLKASRAKVLHSVLYFQRTNRGLISTYNICRFDEVAYFLLHNY